MWWLTSVTTALRRLRHKLLVFEASLSHIVNSRTALGETVSTIKVNKNCEQRTSRCRHSVLFMSLASIHIFKLFCLYMCKFTCLSTRSATSGVILRNANTGSLVGLEALITLDWLATKPLGCWSSLNQHQDYKCTPPSQASSLGTGERTQVLMLVRLACNH